MPSYRVELHSHCQGDPVDALPHTIFEHIDQAKNVGLDAIAVTWHRRICDNPQAVAYAHARGVLLLSGIEAEVDHKHLVVINLAGGDITPTPTWDDIRALRARKPEVLVIAPHPFYPHPTCLGRAINDHPDCLDAVEWCNLHVKWLPSGVNPNLRAARWAHKHGKPLVACSDAHTLSSIGRNASTVEADALTPMALTEALRAGRISFHRNSLEFGPFVRETSKALASQPRHIGHWVMRKMRARQGRTQSLS